MTTDPIQLMQFADYEICELVNEGGMGRVYKAWNKSLERFEAIKFIAPRLIGSQETRERFHREAISVAALDHENIATLFRCGDVGGNPYLAFQYCNGGTLKDRIRGKQLSRTEILGYALELASGLQYAHSRGIIHRDIKPSNVLFHERKLKLIDFGLAKYKTDDRDYTLSGGVGTPLYMSPEQVCGEPAGEQSDIYSFGVLLYEMAAGRRPFEAPGLQEVLRRVTEESPSPLSTVRPDLGDDLCALVDTMLSKERAGRPQSMAEVFYRLQKIKSDSVPDSAGLVTIPLPPADTPKLRSISTPSPARPAALTATLTPLSTRGRLLVLLVAAIMAVFVLDPSRMEQLRRWTGTAAPERPIIAILPFESVSKEQAAVEFSSAMDARLAGELVQSGRSREYFAVSPASEVRSYNIRSVAEARKRLKADYVFGGTVIHGEKGYQILLSLSDGANQRQIKAETIWVDRLSLDRLDSILRDTALRMLPARARASSPLIASANSFSSPAAYELTVRAQGLLRQYTGQGPVDTALELLAQAIRLDPSSPEAHAWMAEAQVQKWQSSKSRDVLKQAEDSAARALQLNSKLGVVHLAAGRVAQQRGEWEKAILEFSAALKANPADGEIYRFIGRVYLDAGKTREAENSFRKAIEMNPDSWASYSSLGYFYARQNRWDMAITPYRHAAELYPEIPLVHSNLGTAYYKLDRLEEAAEEYEISLQKRPNGLAYSNLGSVRFYQGRYADAAELFEHAVADRLSDAPAWSYLGEAYARIPGKESKSREALRKAADLLEASIKVNPRVADSWSQLALVRAYRGDSNGARNASAKAMELAPNSGDVLYRAARVEGKLGATSRSAERLLAALEKGYSKNEALREPDFEQARKDPRLRALLE